MAYKTKKHDYDDDVVVSALQKSIRRAKEEDAMYWALEICDGGNHKAGFTRLCKRLNVIISEDIGLADKKTIKNGLKALKDMKQMYEEYTGFKKCYDTLKNIIYTDISISDSEVVNESSELLDNMKEIYEKDKGKPEWQIVLGHIILLLCRSKKSRIADNFTIDMKNIWDNKKFSVPDYALDYHTSAGNKMGRTKYSKKGIEHFLTEGEKLINESDTIIDKYKLFSHQIRLTKNKK
jgi:replication-associated recombination protein RarA